MQYLFLFEELIPIEALLLAFIVTYIAIPSIVDVSRTKHLFDVPNGRTSHEEVTPTLGGLSIFAGFIISAMLFLYIPDIPYIQYCYCRGGDRLLYRAQRRHHRHRTHDQIHRAAVCRYHHHRPGWHPAGRILRAVWDYRHRLLWQRPAYHLCDHRHCQRL